MANLVDEILSMATPAITSQIASSLGLSGGAVSSVIGAAVPSIMGALVNRGSTPGGAKDIMSSLASATMGSAMGSAMGSNPAAFASQGTSMLTSLLGRSGMSTLTNAVTSSAGVPAAAGATLMGFASQMVMGGLAKSASGMDASGLSNLLSAQQGYISAALPDSISSVVGMAGMGSAATASAGSAVRNASSYAQSSMPEVSAPSMGWLKWAIPVALIALAAWFALGRRDTDDKMAVKPSATTTTTAPAAATMMVDDVDISKSLTGALGDLTSSLGGIKDVATAQAALPKLQGAGTAISTVSGLAAKFSPEQKTAVAGLVTGGMPAITAAAAKAQAMDGVGAILKPVLDGIMGNLGNLTK